MKNTDLRIGNYVEHQTHKIGTVQSLGDTTVLISTNYDAIELSDIKPIPLTEDWLLKFGFYLESDDSYDFYIDLCEDYKLLISKKGRCAVLINEKENIIESLTSYCINHVHQLQNLYSALTNTELKLKTTKQWAN